MEEQDQQNQSSQLTKSDQELQQDPESQQEQQDQQSQQPKFLQAIPRILASTVSIFIFIFLFIYLVLFGIVGLFIDWLAPTANMQLILGNYTNVTSALGAAIAAGASTQHLTQVRKLNRKHEELKKLVVDLHSKIDNLNSAGMQHHK